MKSKPSAIFWFTFSLFVWLHSLPGVLNPGWERVHAFHDEDALSFSPNVYSETDHGPIESIKILTVIEFEEMYISQLTKRWIWVSILLVLGLYSSWLILSESKYWPVTVLIVSGAALYEAIPGTIEIIKQNNSLLGYFSMAGKLLMNSVKSGEGFNSYFLLSSIFAWAFYCLVLFCYSGFVLAARISKMKNVA